MAIFVPSYQSICLFFMLFLMQGWAFAQSPAFDVRKIKLRGVQTHPEQGVSVRILERKVNQWRLESYPQQRLTLEQLEDLAYRVSKFYQDLGFSFVAAFVPKQKIRRGVVIIQVREDKLADVQIRNVSDVQGRDMKREFEDMVGKPVFKPDLEEPILLLNDNPNREVFAYFSRGKEIGETRLNLNVKQTSSAQLDVGVNNTGSPSTGENRWWVNGNIKNPLGWDDQFSLNVTQSFDNTANLFGNLSYQKYLDTRNSYTLSLINNQYQLGEDLAVFDMQGQYLSLGYVARKKLARRFSLSSSQSWSLVYRQSDLTSGLISSLNQKSGALLANYQLVTTDYQVIFGDYLTKSVDWSFIFITEDNDKLDEDVYTKVNGFLQSGKSIGNYVPGFITRFTSKLSIQYTFQELPSADKSPLSGATGVRAFDSGVFSADESVVLQVKLSFMNRNQYGQFDPYLFYDHGYGIRKALESDVGAELSGIGFGMDYRFKDLFKIDASYSVSQETRIGDLTKDESSRFLISVQGTVW